MAWHKTLYAKLAAALLLLLLTLGVLYGAFILYATQVFLREVNQRFNENLARQLLVEQQLVAGNSIDKQTVKEIFKRYMQINPAIEIYLLDVQGNVLAFEAPDQKIKRRRLDLDPIRHFLARDRSFPILGDDPRSERRRKIFSVAPWPLTGTPKQYLYVVLGGEDYDNVLSLLNGSYFLQISTSAVAASVVFGLLAGLFLFNVLTRRLRRLTAGMDLFRRSDFRQFQPYATDKRVFEGDEIDRLGGTFDVMADRIIEQVQALEDKDTLRRNLVANVSHDLRTPLASMQGYLETLLMKDEQLEAQQRHQYLTTAFKHSQRLTRLVAELFELSKLDANETKPHKEPIALGELAQDVVQKFKLMAERAGVDLAADIPTQLPVVDADIGLMERVLDNLVGNAIAHTPAKGTVRVVLQARGSGVRVGVTNSGSVIAAEDLPHVFERFYQAPERRQGGGAGLGLAIVRRILELHGSSIRVSSSPETGTRFTFELGA